MFCVELHKRNCHISVCLATVVDCFSLQHQVVISVGLKLFRFRLQNTWKSAPSAVETLRSVVFFPSRGKVSHDESQIQKTELALRSTSRKGRRGVFPGGSTPPRGG